MRGPTLSILIVTYNSMKHLGPCLEAVSETRTDHEIVIVDNGSSDGTLTWLHENHPRCKVIEAANGGYAMGNNIAAAHAGGEFFLVLNPDTVVSAGAVDHMVSLISADRDSIITPKLLQHDGTVNTCGTTMHFTGITSCNGLGERAENYSGVFASLILSGAAFLISREAWEAVQGFDPAFFMYMEDVDLSLRLRLLGYRILCDAEATVYHDYTLRLEPRKLFYLERNRLMMIAKVYEGRTWRRLLPGLVMAELATWSYSVMKGPRFVWARFMAYVWVMARLPYILVTRSTVQAQRRVRDASLLSLMSPVLPYYSLTKSSMAKNLSLMTTPVFRHVQRSALNLVEQKR